MITVVVTGDGFLLKKVLDHGQYLSIVILVEVKGKIPGVIEGDRFIGALGTDYSGE